MAFGVKKTRNPVIDVLHNGIILPGKVCKACKKAKPLNSFSFANKSKGTKKNICKVCINNKYKGIL